MKSRQLQQPERERMEGRHHCHFFFLASSAPPSAALRGADSLRLHMFCVGACVPRNYARKYRLHLSTKATPLCPKHPAVVVSSLSVQLVLKKTPLVPCLIWTCLSV